MDKRKIPYTISKPQLLHPPAEPQNLPSFPPHNNAPRPLSDIRELSEPSLIDLVISRDANRIDQNVSARRSTSPRRAESLKRTISSRLGKGGAKEAQPAPRPIDDGSSSYSSTPDQSTFYTIPYSSIPRRSSSQTHSQRPTRSHTRKPSVRAAPPPSRLQFDGYTVPNHGQSHSPVKQAVTGYSAVQSDISRRAPSRTYVRTPHPLDILEFPSYRHPRIKLELQVCAPLFVGGGSIEGQVKITVDENERARSRRSLAIGAISLDLLGFEEISNGRKAAFLAVGTELIDADHPPPANMVEPPNPLATDMLFWALIPSTSTLPFMISLPLDTGPPPFQSKNASIRFLLCATVLISDTGKHYRVRTSQDISVLATYDPEKALSSLPSPLTAVDEVSMARSGRCETLKLTAGLHRQVWVSGSSIFVDVHIVNKTHKAVKRLELNLERDILRYKHAPAGTSQKSASQARIFESNEQTMITQSSLKSGQQGWSGVQPHSSGTRTCELELPRGHATVRCGKYFEVRFFLNITASMSNTKLVSVQLPIILIHMNSLDVLPNSVAQVAAAIEEKRAQSQHRRKRSKQREPTHTRQRSVSSPAAMADIRRRPSDPQGRAFAAPRQQSASRKQTLQSDIDDIRRVIDSSPRKFESQMRGPVIKKMGSNMSIRTFGIDGSNSNERQHAVQERCRTPPTKRSQRGHDSGGVGEANASRGPLHRMQSLESMYNKKSISAKRPWKSSDQNVKPRYNFTVVQDRIEPHVLGLSSSSRQPNFDGIADAAPRPATGLSFRERLDRKKFELKGIKAKGSGGLRERSMQWLEQARGRDGEKDGWI